MLLATFASLRFGELAALRRRDLDLLGRQVLRRLVGQEECQLVDELAEHVRRRLDVPQQAQLVLDERVLDLDRVLGHALYDV